jgi:replicative DNA helicase
MSEQVKNLRKKKNENNEYIPDIFNTQIKASKDIEDGIISALLIDITSLDEVSNILKPEMFYYNVNKIIFEVILYLENKKIGIDLITVAEELKNRNKIIEVGGVFYLTQLANKIGSTAHIVSYARLLYENFLERRVAQVGVEIYKKAISQELDVFDLIDYTGKKISEVADSIQGSNQSKMSDAIYEELKLIDTRMFKAQNGSVLGVPTGFKNLDYITGGWQKSDLIILAGRPGMGKTTAAVSMCIYPAILNKIPVAFFSLEMSNEQVVSRMQSFLSGVNVSKIVKKQMTEAEINQVQTNCKELNDAPIYIDDTPNISLLELKGKCRKMVKENKIELVVVDYLQLMRSGLKTRSREEEIAEISRGLKSLAKELNIPVIALSQLSRNVESRGDKKPMLQDLRESGQIEQDADMVVFCYRPEYYGIDQYEVGASSFTTDGLFMLLVAKHRNGELGEVPLTFIAQQTKLTNYNENYSSFKGNEEISSTFVQQSKAIQPNNDFFSESSVKEEDIPF